MKKITAALAMCICLAGQAISPVTLPDISGDGSVHAIATAGTARWITFVSLPTNSTANCSASVVTGCIRVGDSNISNSRGIPIQVGSSFSKLESTSAAREDLTNWYYLVQSGDKLSITYGK